MKWSSLAFGLVAALAAIVWLVSPAPIAAAAAKSPEAVAVSTSAPADKHAEEPPNPLEIKSDLAIWTGVVFLLLLAILWKFAWKPISEGLEKREHYIAAQIEQAEKNNADARRLLEEHEQKLAGAADEVRGIFDKARHEAEQVGREVVEKARTEAKHEQEKAVRQIEQASAAALKELAERSATMAVELAGKIVAAELQPADHAALIQKTVADFAKAKPSNN